MGKKVVAVAEAAWTERREQWAQRRDDIRSPYACDLERVLQSRSFRGLQGKTQVLSPNREGLQRTRLTHSLEVAQTAVEIKHQVAGDIEQSERDDALIECLEHLPPSDLVRTIAMAHDLGHPPFGHDGEKALNACMAPYGGFEANGQTLRILARLEASSREAGANLTRRAMLGVLKYPAPASRLGSAVGGPRKGYYDCEQDVVDWILGPLSPDDREVFTSVETREGRLRTLHRSLDCSIMDVADDIAYGVHDLEDALAAGLVDEATFQLHVPLDVCDEHLDRLGHGYAEQGGAAGYERMVAMLFGEYGERRRALSRITSTLIVAATVATIDGFDEPLLRYRVDLPIHARRFLDALHALVREAVICGPELVDAGAGHMATATAIFDAGMKGLLGWEAEGIEGAREDARARATSDRIATLTDSRIIELRDGLA